MLMQCNEKWLLLCHNIYPQGSKVNALTHQQTKQILVFDLHQDNIGLLIIPIGPDHNAFWAAGSRGVT